MFTGIKKFCHDAIIWTLIFILGPGSLVGCTNDLFGVNTPVSVSLDKTLIEYDSLSYADSTQVLTAEVLLKGGGTTTDVRWDIEAINGQQSAIQVLSTASGRLQFLIKQAGEYRISAISTVNQELSASCVVRVKGYIESLAIANEEGTAITGTLNTSVGATFTLKALYTPSNTSQTDVRWEVEDDAYLSIDYDTGAAIAKAPGTTTITVRSTANPNVSASITVLVKASTTDQSGAASRMSVSPTTMDIPVQTRMNNSYKLTAYVLDTFGNSVDSVGTVRWESSNTDAVTVTADGTRKAYVNALADGEADIYAYFMDPRYESSAELSAKAHVTVTGAVTGISTGFDVVSFPTDYDTSDYPEARINVLYMPENTTQKGFNVSVEDSTLLSIVNRTSDSFDIRTNSREGSTKVRLESVMDRSVYDEFTVNVRQMATDAERISWIELSRNSLTLEPPFDSSMEDIEAYTWVFDEKTGDAVRGEAARFPVAFRADDDSIIRVEKLGGNKVRVVPLRSGETKLIATSEINPEATASIPVTVEGKLEGIVIPVDDIVISLGDKEPRKVEITADPWNALMTTSEGGAGTHMSIRTVPADILNASLSLSGDSKNRLIVSLQGKMPGTADISILGDGEELGTFSASVIPSDDYISALSFDKRSIIMKQDSDGERIMLSAEGYGGSTAKIDRNIRYVLLEGANEYEESEFSRSRILDVTVSSSEDSVYVMPKNSGTVILRAYPDGNSLVSTDVRIEVGGSAIKGTELRELRPYSDYMQVRLGQTASTGVNFIPADYEDKSVNWEVRTSDDDTENVRITRRGTEGTLELQGIEPGKDIIYAESGAEPDVNTQFTVEVVDGDAYAITLDRHYLNYDRNRKADPVITATITKNGSRDTSHNVIWTVQDDEDLITVTERGTANTQAQVHLNDNDALGFAYVTASIEGVENVSATCQVEVIDSTAYDTTPRSLNLGYSSVILEEGKTMEIPYTIVPETADRDTVFDVQYSVNGIAELEENIDGSFVVTAVEEGEVDITVTILDTEVSDTLRVTVTAPAVKPDHIEVNPLRVNLSQEKMDSFESIEATVIGTDGSRMEDLQVTFSPDRNYTRYFLAKGFGAEIDTSKNPSGDADYWGDEEIGLNEYRIKPVSAGASRIRVSYPGIPDAYVDVTVAAEEVIYQEGISELLPSVSKAVVQTGSDYDIWVTLVPENDLQGSITWSSLNDTIAEVTADKDDSRYAKIHGVSEGETTVIASIEEESGPIEARFPVVVADDISELITGITLLPQHIVLDLDAKDLTALSATVFRGGEADESASVDWDVDESLTVSGAITYQENLNAANTVLNISKGTTPATGYITATSADDPEFFAKAFVEVVRSSQIEAELRKVLLNAYTKNLSVGDTFQINASPVPASIASASDPAWAVSYSSSDERVATVSESGLIEAVGIGSAAITVTGLYRDREASAAINVFVDGTVPASEISLSDNIIEFDAVAGTKDISAVLFNEDGDDITDDASFEWHVDDPSVAEISADNDNSSEAVVTPKKMDASTRFTVSSGRLVAEGYIIVGEVDELVGLIVDPASIELAANEKASFTLIAVPERMADKIEIKAVSGSDILSVDMENNEVAASREGSSYVEFSAYDENGWPLDISTRLTVNVNGVAKAQRVVIDRTKIDFSRDGNDVPVSAMVLSSTGGLYDGDVEWDILNGSVASFSTPDTDDPNSIVVSKTGSGETELRASYGTLSSSIPVVNNEKPLSDATKPSALIAANEQVVLYHPDTADAPEEDKKATLEVYYQPDNLRDEYRGLIWTISGSSIEKADTEASYTTADGTFDIVAVREGTSTVTARSQADSSISAEFSVTVLPEGVVVEGGIPRISIDKRSIELDVNSGSERVSATVTNDDGEVSDYADKLTWESVNDLTAVSEIDEKTVSLSAKGKAGYDTVKASYLVYEGDGSTEDYYITASAAVEILDTVAEGQDIRAVTLNDSRLVMLTGSERKLLYDVTPQLPVDVEWIYSEPGIVEVDDKDVAHALKQGSVTVTIQATNPETGTVVRDSVDINVTNTPMASGKWASLTPTPASLSLVPSDSATNIEYELLTLDTREVDLSAEISQIRVVGLNGKVLQTITHDQILEAANDSEIHYGADNPNENDLFNINWYGDSSTRLISVDPLKPGSAYLEVIVADDPDNIAEGAVTARTFVSIGGTLKSLGIQQEYIHLAEGDRQTIELDFNPTNAVINRGDEYFSWTSETDGIISLSDETASSVVVRADNVGQTVLRYIYDEDGDAGSKAPYEAEVVISVDDPETIAGGARMVSFPSSYIEIPYPYERTNAVAKITFFDGTTSTDNIQYRLKNVDPDDTSDSWAQYASIEVAGSTNEDEGVYITPLKAGEVMLEAYYKDATNTDLVASTRLIIRGAVSDIIPSNTSILLYTGGSMVLTASPDDASAPGLQYNWRYEEKTMNNGKGEQVPVSGFQSSIITPISGNNTDMSSVIVAARDVQQVEGEAGYSPTLIGSYPRKGTLYVSLPEYPGVESEIDVTVELLPAENTYPMDLELSETYLTLEPDDTLAGGFTSDEVMTATVSDRDGNTIDATVDWYYYPISSGYDWTEPAESETTLDADGNVIDVTDAGKMYLFQSWLDPKDTNSNTYIQAYMRENTSSIYYRPKTAGQYRMKAVVRENPVLQAECTINVGGEIRSIAADTGPVVELIKGETENISATYTPENALIRDVFWIPESFKTAALRTNASDDELMKIVNTAPPEGTYTFTQNGPSINVLAKETTDETKLFLEYWNVEVMGELSQAANDMDGLTALEYRNAVMNDDGTVKSPMYSYQITIRINPKDMTTMNFSVEGLDLAIDPSEIDSVISFSVNANASGADTTKTFSNWEWVDVDIVGSETGYVYATTRLIDDPNDLASPEGQKKKVADWEFYKSGAIDQPLAVNGRIYRNGNTYSFQLNQAGLTIEPLYVTATIQEDVKDGWLNGDGTGETAEEKGEYLFDSDTLAFNQGRKLVHIGGAVGSISPDETYFNLNGTDNQTAPAGTTNIDLILGASARLTVAYSPAYTHQKGVIWYVESGSFTDFQAMPDSSQCSVFGRHETDGAIKLRAVSIYDPWFEKMAEKYDAACGGDGQWLTQYLSKTDTEHRQSVPTAGDTENRWRYPTTAELKSGLYVDFQITVRSPIEKAVFTALSLGRNNSATDSSGLPQAPDYDFLNEKDFPPTKGENEIWCYDLTGASGSIAEEDSRIDAYLVTADLDPDYDYPLTFELVKGAEIGSLDNRDLDEDSNQFRFVPRGMVKDIVGEGYSINYGDVTIRASNSDLNFSRDFVLHYTPSNMKLVKYIGERDRPSDDPSEFGTTVPEEWQREVEFLTGTYEIDTSEDKIPLWDVYVPHGPSASEPTVYGLETLVLYPGERFDLAAISYFNGVPQYASRGMVLNEEDEPIKYALQFAVKETPNSSSFQTGYLEFESGYYQDAYGTGNLDDKNPDGSYDANRTNDTGVSGWYYDDPSATITARKQGTFYLQYSLAPVIDPPYDEATGTDPDPYADVSSKMTHGLYVYIVDPVNQVLSEVVDNGPVNAGNLKISTLIPYKISASQLTSVDEDGNPMPSHWFMAERGACIETIVDSEGEEQDGYLYRGRAFASFSVDGVPLTNFNESGQAANIETISGTVDINAKVIPDYSMNKNLGFRNQPSLTDVGFLGDYGLNRFRQIYGCDIEEDGSIVKKYIDDNWSNTIDLSDLNVRFYSHTGLATPGSGHSGGKIGSEIAIIKPPRNAEKLSFTNDALNCLFEWSGTDRDGAAYDIRNTLKELDLSGNDFGGLDLIDFTALRKLDVSDNSNLISTVNERVLNVISPNTAPALVWLNADDTVFDRIVAEFRKGTEEEFLSLGYSFDGYPSIFSARTSNPYGASDLEAIELSGAIGYADVSTNKYLKSFIHSSSVAEDNTSFYSYDGGYEDFIQVLNLGGTAYIPDAITEAYGDAYSELGHPSSLFPDRNFEKIGPGLHLNTFRITTVGYLRSNDTDMKNILTFDMGRVRRFGGDPYADEPDDVKDVDFNKISSIDTINIGEVYEGTHAAFNESPSLRNVVAEDMRGTLELSYNTALNETHINQYVSQPPSSTLVLDCSELSDLSGINANVNTLQLNDMPNLTEVAIGGRESNLGKVKRLLVNSTVDPMDYSSAGRPEGSRIRKLDIASDSDLQWLECWGGGSLEDVNIQGEDIYHIDMHEAGLYGKQWDIGSFHFAPMKPTDNIDSLGSPDLPWGNMAQPEAEYILGMALSSDTYETFRIYDIRYEQVGYESVSDSDTRPIYNWVFEVEGDLANLVSSDSDSATNRVVDWKKWLPGLQRSDAEMILYGNNINFRYFLGAQSILMSAAYENGIIPEPEFEGRLYKFRMPAAGWLPNEEYNRLASSDQAADQEEYARVNRIVGNGYLVGNENVWNSGIGFGWNLITSYNADDYSARNEYGYSQKRAIQTRYYSAWPMERIEEELEDQPGNYWHAEFIKEDFIDVLNDYFIYVDEGYEFEMREDIEEFADMESGAWRNFDFQSEDRNDFTEADFSIRFGTIPQEAYESEYGQDVAMLSDKRAIPFAVHNKWKGKAGIWGLLSQESTGMLTVKSAENAIVESSNKDKTRGDVLSSYTTKEGVRTREIWIGPDGSLVELTGFDDLRLPKFGNQVFLKQNGNTVKPDGILIDYHLYDQWTKNASHNGVALIFPFAP